MDGLNKTCIPNPVPSVLHLCFSHVALDVADLQIWTLKLKILTTWKSSKHTFLVTFQASEEARPNKGLDRFSGVRCTAHEWRGG